MSNEYRRNCTEIERTSMNCSSTGRCVMEHQVYDKWKAYCECFDFYYGRFCDTYSPEALREPLIGYTFLIAIVLICITLVILLGIALYICLKYTKSRNYMAVKHSDSSLESIDKISPLDIEKHGKLLDNKKYDDKSQISLYNTTLYCIMILLLVNMVTAQDMNRLINCIHCKNVCWEAESGIAKLITSTFNGTCEHDCVNYPFQKHIKILNSDKCQGGCVTVHALQKVKVVSDGSIFTLRYVMRLCAINCSNEICDFNKLEECKYSPIFINEIKRRFKGERESLQKIINNGFKNETLTDIGFGGELQCCSTNECNTGRETVVDHSYIREEM